MKAVRMFGINDVRVVDIEKPIPGSGEVLIKVGGAGVCHSDLHVIEHGTGTHYPFTLGHEVAGWVEASGEGVTAFQKGEAVMVYGPWGCGSCKPCLESYENYCDNQAKLNSLSGGLGKNGGMAEYMIVPFSRLVIPIGTLNPAHAAPLTDAALTPYHAIKRSLSKLTPDCFVAVIGVGGLGHMALQILKAMTSVTIIACDLTHEKLEFARKYGADYVFNSASSTIADEILSLTGSKKCGVVLDFVGAAPTFEIGRQIIGLNGDWTICGLAGATYGLSSHTLPWGARISIPFWGSRSELLEVIELASKGLIKVETTEYPLDQALKVYELLATGKIQGRAVLVP